MQGPTVGLPLGLTSRLIGNDRFENINFSKTRIHPANIFSSSCSSSSGHVTISSEKESSLDSYFTVPDYLMNEVLPSSKTSTPLSSVSPYSSSRSRNTSIPHSNSKSTRLIPGFLCGFGVCFVLFLFLHSQG